jgi:hypothetical protein
MLKLIDYLKKKIYQNHLQKTWKSIQIARIIKEINFPTEILVFDE